MTKSEFVDQVAAEPASPRVTPARPSTRSWTSSRRPEAGGEINFTGFGKFSVAERGARQGVNPQTGERIQIAASRVPRFSARVSAAQEGASRAAELAPEGAGISPTGWRRSSRSAAAESCSGSTPTRPRSGRVRRPRTRATRTSPRRHRRGRRAALPRRHRGRRPGVRRGQAAARLLRAARRAGLGGARADRAAAREHGLLVIADGKRGDVPVTAAAYAQALVGATPGPVRRVPGSAPTPSPPTRCSAATRSSRSSTRRREAGAGLLRARAHLESRRRRPPGRRATRRCTSGWRGWSPSWARGPGDCGLSLVGAVSGATGPSGSARLRELMPRAIFLLPGRRAPRAAAPRPSARRSRPTRPPGWSRRRGRSSTPTPSAAVNRPRRRPRPRRSCGPRPGTSDARRELRRGRALSCARPSGARCPNRSPRSPARLLAPIALVVFALASSSSSLSSSAGDDGDGGTDELRRPDKHRDADHHDRRTTTSRSARPTWSRPATRSGGIAEKTGVTVERLQELNPELDPQALVSGQKIKLRQ